MERVVVALGGNALLRRGAEDTVEEMYRSSRNAAEKIADIAAAGWQVVVTHGNGPQVGRILLQQEAARGWVHPMPLDVCGAQSQGQIGYLLQVTIGDVFFERGMERPVVTLLTLTRVPVDDPAFTNPTKPIGPFYEEAEAQRLADEQGWTVVHAEVPAAELSRYPIDLRSVSHGTGSFVRESVRHDLIPPDKARDLLKV